MELVVPVVLGVLAIALATALSPKVGIAGPLILVLVGIGVGLLPFVEVPEIDPEIILVGVLPPLLYSAAVALPAVEFRRDFGPIAGLSFLLVILSSVLIAVFLILAIPGIDPAIALAMGAILSPTDAVATGIVKRLGVSRRVVTMLEGESLLNDATALVLLRTMVATAAVAVGGATAAETETGVGLGFLPAFAWGVLVAAIVGGVVGWLNLRVRSLVRNPAANTAIGFVVPFIAYVPTEELGGSGLVAAVVAGIITGQGAVRRFTAEQRNSDEHNWRTVELVLEGAVFLLMGLELKGIVEDNFADHNGLGTGITLAAASLLIIIVARAGYVSLLVWLQSRRARDRQRERLEQMNDRIDLLASGEASSAQPPVGGRRRSRRAARRPAPDIDSPQVQGRIARMRSRIARALNDVDYYQASPLGWKHGTVIVWAGMRGVVTLAAAQTLPREAPDRALLVFIAFAVAVGSLMLQGFTLPWLVRRLHLATPADDTLERAEQAALEEELRDAAVSALSDGTLRRRDGSPFPLELIEKIAVRMSGPPKDAALGQDMIELRLATIDAQRLRLIDLTRGGGYSTPALRRALAELDADQLSLELRLDED